jgi:hypothetical protein
VMTPLLIAGVPGVPPREQAMTISARPAAAANVLAAGREQELYIPFLL